MSEKLSIDIIYDCKKSIETIVVAKFKVGNHPTRYCIPTISNTGLDDGLTEYCAVFHTKTYCYSFFLYEKDGEFIKDETWCHREYYDKKNHNWIESKKEYYDNNQITINDIIQERIDE